MFGPGRPAIPSPFQVRGRAVTPEPMRPRRGGVHGRVRRNGRRRLGGRDGRASRRGSEGAGAMARPHRARSAGSTSERIGGRLVAAGPPVVWHEGPAREGDALGDGGEDRSRPWARRRAGRPRPVVPVRPREVAREPAPPRPRRGAPATGQAIRGLAPSAAMSGPRPGGASQVACANASATTPRPARSSRRCSTPMSASSPRPPGRAAWCSKPCAPSRLPEADDDARRGAGGRGDVARGDRRSEPGAVAMGRRPFGARAEAPSVGHARRDGPDRRGRRRKDTHRVALNRPVFSGRPWLLERVSWAARGRGCRPRAGCVGARLGRGAGTRAVARRDPRRRARPRARWAVAERWLAAAGPAEHDAGVRPGPASEERERVGAFERERREPCQPFQPKLHTAVVRAWPRVRRRRRHRFEPAGRRVFHPSRSRPPACATIALAASRGAPGSSTRTARPAGSSRSTACCRSPRRPATPTRRGDPRKGPMGSGAGLPRPRRPQKPAPDGDSESHLAWVRVVSTPRWTRSTLAFAGAGSSASKEALHGGVAEVDPLLLMDGVIFAAPRTPGRCAGCPLVAFPFVGAWFARARGADRAAGSGRGGPCGRRGALGRRMSRLKGSLVVRRGLRPLCARRGACGPRRACAAPSPRRRAPQSSRWRGVRPLGAGMGLAARGTAGLAPLVSLSGVSPAAAEKGVRISGGNAFEREEARPGLGDERRGLATRAASASPRSRTPPRGRVCAMRVAAAGPRPADHVGARARAGADRPHAGRVAWREPLVRGGGEGAHGAAAPERLATGPRRPFEDRAGRGEGVV